MSPASNGSHPSHDALVQWRDEGRTEDRDSITSHLATCRSCAAAYAELVRLAPVMQQPAHFNPADFVQRGYAARRPTRLPLAARAFGSWRLWAGALGAAAALIVAAVLIPFGANDVVRGAGVDIVAPSTVLEWKSHVTASQFRVELKDANGAVLYHATVAGSPVTLPPEIAGRLQPGQTYVWTVSALDSDQQIVTTASRTFSAGGGAR
jgi:hypothetical protein